MLIVTLPMTAEDRVLEPIEKTMGASGGYSLVSA